MNNPFALFENIPLLSWLPCETFFSLVSRHHHLWGHGLASQTNFMLFGKKRGGTHHDFPSCIDDFTRRTEFRYGSAEIVCSQHTLRRSC